MKKWLITFAVLTAVVILFPFCVSAQENRYIVKLKTDNAPYELMQNLTVLNENHRLYISPDDKILSCFEEYIENIQPDTTAFLIDDSDTALPFSIKRRTTDYWHHDLLKSQYLFNLETYGNEVVVGVIDSGCSEHKSLKDNLLIGKNYISQNEDTSDNVGHGTHVSGIIACNMEDENCTGFAPKAKIVSLKCFESGKTTLASHLTAAIYDAVDVYNCRIINMSFGLKKDDPFLRTAVQYAASKGVVMVAAVGNYGTSGLYYPAAYEEVIGVGAIDANKQKTDFSQYNTSVFVVAPGDFIKSTSNDGGYIYMRGTSQAAPEVTGVIATMLSADSSLTAEDIKRLIICTSEDLGETGYDPFYGYGLIDEEKLFLEIIENKPYYVSPINITDEGVYVLIKKLSAEEISAVSVFAGYSTEGILHIEAQKIDLSNNDYTVVGCDNTVACTHFFWDSMSLRPLAAKR